MSYSRREIIVNLSYPCYICAVEFGSAKEVIGHIYHVHGYILDFRPVGRSRPLERKYKFEKRFLSEWDVQRFACPSCWYHCATDIELLTKHIMETHNPSRIEGFVHPVSDDEDDRYELVESSEEENTGNSQVEKPENKEVVENRQQLGNDIVTTLEKLNVTFKKFFS